MSDVVLPPGPPLPSPLQTALFTRRPFEFVRLCQRRYGDLFTLRLFGFGEVVYLADPEAIGELFAHDGRESHAGEANALLEPVTGSGSLLLLDRQEHLAERRLLTPAFHGDAIRALEGVARQAAEREEQSWPTAEALRARPAMQRITFEIIVRVVLGVDDARLRARPSARDDVRVEAPRRAACPCRCPRFTPRTDKFSSAPQAVARPEVVGAAGLPAESSERSSQRAGVARASREMTP